jgi:hypothetical protein
MIHSGCDSQRLALPQPAAVVSRAFLLLTVGICLNIFIEKIDRVATATLKII